MGARRERGRRLGTKTRRHGTARHAPHRHQALHAAGAVEAVRLRSGGHDVHAHPGRRGTVQRARQGRPRVEVRGRKAEGAPGRGRGGGGDERVLHRCVVPDACVGELQGRVHPRRPPAAARVARAAAGRVARVARAAREEPLQRAAEGLRAVVRRGPVRVPREELDEVAVPPGQPGGIGEVNVAVLSACKVCVLQVGPRQRHLHGPCWVSGAAAAARHAPAERPSAHARRRRPRWP